MHTKEYTPFQNPAVEATFRRYPEALRNPLLVLRELIFAVAEKTLGVGVIEETLKWGEPSYLTTQSKKGSTIRLACKPALQQYGIYFNCKTLLVSHFKYCHGDVFSYEGNRAIVFDQHDQMPMEPLQDCIAKALTYHVRNNNK